MPGKQLIGNTSAPNKTHIVNNLTTGFKRLVYEPSSCLDMRGVLGREIHRTAVPKLINPYIGGTLFAVF
jgi:hypothetical protein